MSKIDNFKGKQNSNWFARNPQNINKAGRPLDVISQIAKKALINEDYVAGKQAILEYINQNDRRLSLREIQAIEKLSFATFYLTIGGDPKEYRKVMWIR